MNGDVYQEVVNGDLYTYDPQTGELLEIDRDVE